MMWPFFAVAAAVEWTETVATAAVTAGPSAAAARPADAALLSGFVSAELQAGADSMASSVSAVPGEMPCYLPVH